MQRHCRQLYSHQILRPLPESIICSKVLFNKMYQLFKSFTYIKSYICLKVKKHHLLKRLIYPKASFFQKIIFCAIIPICLKYGKKVLFQNEFNCLKVFSFSNDNYSFHFYPVLVSLVSLIFLIVL